MTACAPQGAAPNAPKDPCVEPAGLRSIVAGPGTYAEHERAVACKQQQEQEAERRQREHAEEAQAELVAAREKEAKAIAEAEAQERAEADAQAERFREISAAREREAEAERYAEALGAFDCTPPSWGTARMKYEVLREYEATEERDRAIDALERCRQKHIGWARREGARLIAEKRAEFAILIEDDFDASFPKRRGALVAKAEGATLRVTLAGELHGRPRHSQELVDNWCEEDDTQPLAWGMVFMFSKVVLKDEHGTFSCKPTGWPGSTAGLVASFFLHGADAPLSKAPGEKPTPK